jgi:hypothetical protein
MGEGHVARKSDMKNATKIKSINLKGTDHFGDLGEANRKLLKLNLKVEGVRGV